MDYTSEARSTEVRVNGNRKVYPLIFFEGLDQETIILHQIDIHSKTKTTSLYMTIKKNQEEIKYKVSCSRQYAKEGHFNFFGAPQKLKVYLVKVFWKAEQLFSYVLQS
jgi:hypothetical protein